MKVYTRCSGCKSIVSFWTWESDRVGLKMSKGNSVDLTCKRCNFSGKYVIDDFKAKESKIAHLIALLVFFVGTPILLVLLWDKMFMTNYIYSIFILVIPIIIPSFIFGIIHRNDRLRVMSFNRS